MTNPMRMSSTRPDLQATISVISTWPSRGCQLMDSLQRNDNHLDGRFLRRATFAGSARNNGFKEIDQQIWLHMTN